MTTIVMEPPLRDPGPVAPAPKKCAFCLERILPGEEEAALEGQALHAGGHFISFRGRMEKVRIGGGL